jgi:hypothetical protein
MGVLGRITKNLTVRIDGVVAAIRNENLPNTILERYRCSNSLGIQSTEQTNP